MATKAHPVTWYIATNWESYYASAVLSGIVGDEAHQRGGGYHISIENNRATNYSVIRPDDKAPPGTWPRDLAAAIDMSMNPNDMNVCSSRLWHVWNDTSDPRRIYLNGFNGWFNDGGPAKRYDFVTQGISTTTSDHKWHVHNEIRRRYVTDMFAANAILSILRGETKEQYLAGIAGSGDEEMFCTHGDIDAVGQYRVKALQRAIVRAGYDLTPVGGVDGQYGDGTAKGLATVIGFGDGRNYGDLELDALFAKAYGGQKGEKGDKGDPGEPGKTPTKVKVSEGTLLDVVEAV